MGVKILDPDSQSRYIVAGSVGYEKCLVGRSERLIVTGDGYGGRFVAGYDGVGCFF